jgi:hypothetical protein
MIDNWIGNWYLWLGIFIVLLVVFLLCLRATNRKRKYMVYFFSGALLGFYFDIVSFTKGYYSYPNIFPLTIMGLPLSMTIAEGFSIVITMRIVEYVKSSSEKYWK